MSPLQFLENILDMKMLFSVQSISPQGSDLLQLIWFLFYYYKSFAQLHVHSSYLLMNPDSWTVLSTNQR